MQHALLVLGVHRGGTSAAAGALVALGATPPKTPMRSQPDNQAGFWESEVLCALHERLLHSAGSHWTDWRCLDTDWFVSPAGAAFAVECRSLLRQEFGNAPLLVIKDPRVSRFVPFWQEALRAEHLTASVVLVVRRPMEVAQSLAVRNGFSNRRSLLIWLRHMLEAEAASRTMRRTLVAYDELLNNSRVVMEKVAVDLQLPSLTTSEAGSSSMGLRPDLRHHTAGLETLIAPPVLEDWIRRTWHGLSLLSAPSPADRGDGVVVLDTVKHEFDAYSAALAGVEGQERESALRVEIEKQAAAIDAAQRDGHDLRATMAQLQAALVEATERGLTEAEVARQRFEYERFQSEALRRELDVSEARVRALLCSVSWRVTAPLRAAYRVVTRAPRP
jgi:hypothetical protein